jgi:predicted transcriptional regulator
LKRLPTLPRVGTCSNKNVAAGEVGELIQAVHAALSSLGKAATAPEVKQREPAVSFRSSIKPDALVCLVCGMKNKLLKRHLHAHGLTPPNIGRSSTTSLFIRW